MHGGYILMSVRVFQRCRHDDVIKWKFFSRYWPFVRGIHQWPVNFPHKGQWRRALMFSLICAWINGWVNDGEAGDLKRHRAHYDVSVIARDWIVAVRFLIESIFAAYVKDGQIIKNDARLSRAGIVAIRTVSHVYWQWTWQNRDHTQKLRSDTRTNPGPSLQSRTYNPAYSHAWLRCLVLCLMHNQTWIYLGLLLPT